MKTIFDFTVSLIALIILFIPFLIIALLIKLLMPGPVFFIQERIGKNGSSFKLFKFRTMKVANGKSSGSFDAGDNSRITSFGGFLRKYKIDELPQIINVLFANMSFVGPRPEVRKWTEVYPEKWQIVHSVKPGITDNASIEFRNEEIILSQSLDPIKTYKEVILPRKLELYIEYVNTRSFWGDIGIILKTLKVL